MKCEDVVETVTVEDPGSPQFQASLAHISECDDCRHALRATDGLTLLRDRDVGAPPVELLPKMAKIAAAQAKRTGQRKGFWYGTGVGGLIAATLFGLALGLGWFGEPGVVDNNLTEFAVAMNEPRTMDIAIETDRALSGATITILLAGEVKLDGFGEQMELAWTEDLKAGINRLSLPVFASGTAGGQVIVRLDHPDNQQVFVINLVTNT